MGILSVTSAAQSADDLKSRAKAAYEHALKQHIGGFDDKALDYVELALRLDPSNSRCLVLKAEVLKKLEEPKLALATMDKAVALAPKDGTIWAAKAGLLHDLHQEQPALVAANNAIRFLPKDAGARFVRAEVLRGQNNFEAAKRDYDIAVMYEPLNRYARMGRIECEIGLGQSANVIADCAHLIKTEKSAYGLKYALTKRSYAYSMLKNFKQAKSDLEQALQLWPDDIKIHRALMALCNGMGDTKTAAIEQRKIKAFDADF
jgi:Tfp pilus assembly protein PilF